MDHKPVFFHLGLPKCASTSLQAALARAPDINYAGFYYDNNGGCYWKSDALATLFDRELRFSCTQEERSRATVEAFIDASAHPAFFSSESATLRFLPWDLPTAHKLKFIDTVFPAQTRFIFVYKHPLGLLRSIYKEWLLLGYREGFGHFCRELFTFREISLFDDLCLGRFLERFDEQIGLERLSLIFLDKEDMWKRLAAITGLDLADHGQRLNASVSDTEAALIRNMNHDIRDMDPFFDSIEIHRAYFDLDDDQRKFSTARKRRTRKAASRELSAFHSVPAHELQGRDEAVADYLAKDLEAASAILRGRGADTAALEAYTGELRAEL